MSFNLKKYSKKSDNSESYPKKMDSLNSERDYSLPDDNSDTVQGLLSESRNDSANKQTVENQLEDVRISNSDAVITESQVDKSNSYWPHRQHSDGNRPPIKPNDLLSESYDQKHYAAFSSKNKDSDTEFWDKFVGEQLSGDKTTIVGQVPDNGSQLPNHPERFKNIAKKDRPNPSDSDDAFKSNKAFKSAEKMQELDSQIFSIYYKAARAQRDLFKHEREKIAQISLDKVSILENQ